MHKAADRVAKIALGVALSLVLSYVESYVPLFPMFPGAKIGFANIVTLYMLYRAEPLTALTVAGMRTVLSGLLFSGPVSILYGLLGTLFGFFGMWLLKKTNRFSVVGVSAAGGALHNMGQLSAARILLGTDAVYSYLSYLILAGTLCGIGIGFLSKLCIERIPAGGKA